MTPSQTATVSRTITILIFTTVDIIDRNASVCSVYPEVLFQLHRTLDTSIIAILDRTTGQIKGNMPALTGTISTSIVIAQNSVN